MRKNDNVALSNRRSRPRCMRKLIGSRPRKWPKTRTTARKIAGSSAKTGKIADDHVLLKVRDYICDVFGGFSCHSGAQKHIKMNCFQYLRTLFCVFMSRRCITLHLGKPKCFVNEVCTACFASVVHRLCDF